MDSFWGNIFKRRSLEEEEIREVLRRLPMFSGLKDKDLAALERILYRREYCAGEEVFRQGDPTAGMYIIVKGTVEVIFEPTGQVLAELTDGDFFGELALLGDTPRSATIRCKTDCQLLGFFQSDLYDLLERNPKLGVKILLRLARVIGERLIRSNEQVDQMRRELHELKKQLDVAGE
ncbi:MAG: cyclic nucleotide-binding domain-containing protein [Calditrichaeota bacterium]|nr:MAG: cyclic nucleotide-binding domain-containing protein [Calditrichota bacterium]